MTIVNYNNQAKIHLMASALAKKRLVISPGLKITLYYWYDMIL